MAGDLQPLDQKFPIVDPRGNPTLYFIQWAQQRQIDIQNGITAEQCIEIITQYLADHQLQQGSGISIAPSGNISDSPTIAAEVQAILDQISTIHGTVLFRGAADWQALAPGTAGQVLTSGGPGADVSWAAGGGGGGSLPTYYSGTDVDLVTDPGAGGSAIVTVNIPASNAARNFLVNSFVTFFGAHAIDAVIAVDGVLKHNTLRYVDGGDRTFWIHCGPIVVTIPGDNAAHTITMQCADVGALGAITIADRWLSAQQIDGSGGAAAGDGWTLLGETTLAAAAASVSFTGIPPDYEDLQILAECRSTNAAEDALIARFNADAGNNYNWYVENRFGIGSGLPSSFARCGAVGSTGYSAGVYAINSCEIYGYAKTTRFKHYQDRGMFMATAGAGFLDLGNGVWKSNAAINSVTLSTSSAFNFDVGSRFRLYGGNA
jgi:hypothetical protein